VLRPVRAIIIIIIIIIINCFGFLRYLAENQTEKQVKTLSHVTTVGVGKNRTLLLARLHIMCRLSSSVTRECRRLHTRRPGVDVMPPPI